jgi:hypothetical protein
MAVAEQAVVLSIAPASLAEEVSLRNNELILRLVAYSVLLTAAWWMWRGHNAARWFLTLVFGVFGTVSLVLEPLTWIAKGNSVLAWMSSADTESWAIAVFRVLHLLCVLIAVANMFGGTARRHFFGRAAGRVTG